MFTMRYDNIFRFDFESSQSSAFVLKDSATKSTFYYAIFNNKTQSIINNCSFVQISKSPRLSFDVATFRLRSFPCPGSCRSWKEVVGASPMSADGVETVRARESAGEAVTAEVSLVGRCV